MDLPAAARNGDVVDIFRILVAGADVDHADENGRTALFAASFHGHVDAIDALVRHGANVSIADKNGHTALSWASLRGKVDAIDALVRHGANVNHADKMGLTTLNIASQRGHVDAIDALVRHGANVNHADNNGWTVLFWASRLLKADAIDALVTAGANVSNADKDGRTALFQASEKGKVDTIDALVRHGANVNHADNESRTALFEASKEGHSEAIDALVKAGADVNYNGYENETALFEASSNGHVGAIDALVRHGADVNHYGDESITALSLASEEGHVEAIHALVRHGAEVNQPDDGYSQALPTAAHAGQVGAIKALVKHGADVNFKTNSDTVLFNASSSGNAQAIDELVRHGAKVSDTNIYGETALFRASSAEAADVLVKAGVDVNHADRNGRTALFGMTDVTIIDTLIGLGVDVDHVDKDGRTSLFMAVGSTDAINSLVKNHGADVNHVAKDGKTALFLAADQGNYCECSSIDALVSAGANINHVMNDGHTALSLYEDDPSVKDKLIDLGASTEFELFRKANGMSKTRLLQCCSISLRDYIVDIVDGQTDLGKRDPYNISLDTFSDDGRMGMFFRYGYDTVVSIYFSGSLPRVAHLEATAPICTGAGRVIYTKKKDNGQSHVYENSIDLGLGEVELCHALSTPYEKNWGCFGRTRPGNYFIVYSVVPLRIFKVENYSNCSELPVVQLGFAYENPPDKMVVKKEYPNLGAIERMFVDGRDSRGTSIFRGGTRGIEFGDEYLFVGHVTLHKKADGCFPSWFVETNTTDSYKGYPRMYFMYFFTVRIANGMFKISRMSSCFQPPNPNPKFHKIIFPCGIARRKTDIVVSFGRDDTDCLITSYPEANVNTMLAPVHFWNENNYVFHPNYASSLKRPGSANDSPVRSMWRNILPSGRVGLIGTSPDSDGRFNPAITSVGTQGNKFVTAWRKLNGSVESWKGYNQVAMESCSLQIEGGDLVYKRESETVEFQVGNSVVGGEDPRLITENGCPLLMVNDIDGNSKRRMYVHNLETDDSMMTTHPFCHNISGAMEKNWGPFYVGDKLFFVYSVEPLKVGKVGKAFSCPLQIPTNIECKLDLAHSTKYNLEYIFYANRLKMRGGTPGLLFADNEYLFVGHAVQDDESCFPDFTVQRSVNASDDPDWRKEYSKFYTAFFYTIGLDTIGIDDDNLFWEIKRISCCSHFPGKRENFTKIHFPAGLAKANLGGEFEDAFIMSFGEKDMYGGFCAVNRKFLNYVLRPVSEWDVHNYVVDVNYFQNVANIDPEL